MHLNLNTSYVNVQLVNYNKNQKLYCHLNTSYVNVQRSQGFIGYSSTTFKYILC